MREKKKAPRLGGHGGVNGLLAALLCVIIGLLIGFVALVVLSWVYYAKSGSPYGFADVVKTAYSGGFKQILMGGFFLRPLGVGQFIASAAPLLMCGLSVGFAFKTGLFNIGAAGQYTLGAFGGLLFAIVFHWPWWACLLAATVFGAIWGAIPGLFKAYLNINEVISAIMFNWIGLYAVNTIMYGNGKSVMYDANRTKTWSLWTESYQKALIPGGGRDGFIGGLFNNRSTTIAIFLAILMAILIYIIINKTTFGYELKACGHNKSAAKYAGINEKRNIVLSMTIAGALAGFGGGLYYLSGVAEWSPMDSNALPSMGFDGIAVALLASSNPIGTIFSALLISHISTGGGFMNANVFPPEIASVISGIIIYLCAFSLLFRNGIGRVFHRGTAAQVKTEDEPSVPAPPDVGKEGSE